MNSDWKFGPWSCVTKLKYVSSGTPFGLDSKHTERYIRLNPVAPSHQRNSFGIVDLYTGENVHIDEETTVFIED